MKEEKKLNRKKENEKIKKEKCQKYTLPVLCVQKSKKQMEIFIPA